MMSLDAHFTTNEVAHFSLYKAWQNFIFAWTIALTETELYALRPSLKISSNFPMWLFLKEFKHSNVILKIIEIESLRKHLVDRFFIIFKSCLSSFDVTDVNALILIQRDSISSKQHLYGGGRHVFDWAAQHPTVTWTPLYPPLFGSAFPFFFFFFFIYLFLLKRWGAGRWGERKKEGGVTMANISVRWGRTLPHKWHTIRRCVCACL